jgi:integrase
MRLIPSTLKGKRDRAILALLICCGLRRTELVSLEVDRIQQREGGWVIPDLVGKGNRLRTVTIPAAVKVRIDACITAAKICEGKIFRPVNKGDRVAGKSIADEKAIWQLVVHYARATSLGKLAPHDLRRYAARRVGNSNRSSCSWATPPSRPPSATWGRNRT